MMLLILLALNAGAETTIQPCEHAKAIYENEIARKSTSSFLEIRDVCRIHWTPRLGETIVFEDKQAASDALNLEMDALEAKDDSDLTIDDLKRAVRVLAKLRKLQR